MVVKSLGASGSELCLLIYMRVGNKVGNILLHAFPCYIGIKTTDIFAIPTYPTVGVLWHSSTKVNFRVESLLKNQLSIMKMIPLMHFNVLMFATMFYNFLMQRRKSAELLFPVSHCFIKSKVGVVK